MHHFTDLHDNPNPTRPRRKRDHKGGRTHARRRSRIRNTQADAPEKEVVGKHKCANGKLLDKYGDNLILSNMAGAGGGSDTTCSSGACRGGCRQPRWENTREVYGLVAAYINQGADTGMSARKRQSIIPDFAISSAAGRPRRASVFC